MGYKRSRTKKVKGVRMRKLCRLSLSTRGFICLYLLPAVAVSLASPTIHMYMWLICQLFCSSLLYAVVFVFGGLLTWAISFR